jgi:hypothetical protein
MSVPARWNSSQPGAFIERRKNPRLPSQAGAYAFLNFAKMIGGHIQDINEDGLSFRYVANHQQLEGKHLVDIMTRNGRFHCHRRPCTVVWDRAEPQEFSMGPFTMRVCAIRFDDLTDAQKAGVRDLGHMDAIPQPATRHETGMADI